MTVWVRAELFGGFQLMTKSMLGNHPAGGRLLKAEPHPIEKFSFDNKMEADEAAEKLQEYLKL